MFSSQETPEEQAAAFTAPPQSMISPKTLFVLTKEEMQQKGTPPCNKKKETMRKKKGDAASTSVRPADRVLDRLMTPWRKMHYLGEPMLSSEILKDMGSSFKDVNDSIMYLENQLLKQKITGTRYTWSRCPPMWALWMGTQGIFSLLDSKTSSGSCTCSGWTKSWSA
jgi:hypothetical protein